MPRIFISYRKVDTPWTPDLVFEYLKDRFGADQVFKSGQSIPAGADFADTLLVEAATADVMLVLIGPDWLSAAATDGSRKLDAEDDWVRREIATAFHNRRHVVPLLLGDEVMLPSASELPADIAQLARCQFVRIYRSSADFGLNKIAVRLLALVPGLAANGAAAGDAGPASSTAPMGQAVPPGLPGRVEVRGGDGTTTTVVGGTGPLSAATGKHAIAVTAGSGSKVRIVTRARQFAVAHPLLALLIVFSSLGGTTLGTVQIVEAAQSPPQDTTLIQPASVTGSSAPADTVSSTSMAATAPSLTDTSPPATSSSSALAPRFDPPEQFDSGSKTLAPLQQNTSSEMAWGEDGAAFLFDSSNTQSATPTSDLERFDPLQDAPTWQTTLKGKALADSPSLAPVSGRPAVIALVAAYTPPSGTTPGHADLHVEAVDAATGAVDWDTLVLKDAGNGGIAGSDDSVVALSIVTGNVSETMVLNSKDGSVRWTSQSFVPEMVANGVVVGGRRKQDPATFSYTTTLQGVSENDPSKVLWTKTTSVSTDRPTLAAYGTTALNAGPRLIEASEGSDHDVKPLILDAATGKAVDISIGLEGCVYDHQATVVCSDGDSGMSKTTVAFDAKTWKRLWSLPDAAANRLAFNVSAAWHGAVYGNVPQDENNLSVDARTGADNTPSLAILPTTVRPGVAAADGFEYPATQ